MMTQDRDYEDILRRALTAAAESIEPGGDGLQRIRHRLDSRRSPQSVFVRVRRMAGSARDPLARPAGPAHRRGPGRAAADRAAVGTPARPGQLPRPPVQPARTAAGRRAPRPGQPARAAGTRRGLAEAGPRGVGRRGHRGGRGGHPQPRDGHPDQPGQYNIGTTSPGSSLSGSGTTANSKRWKLPLGVTPAPTTGTGQRDYAPAAPALPAVACTPTPKPAVTTSAPARGRHGDADPDPERVRDRHAHPDPERVRDRHAHPDQPGHQRHGYRARPPWSCRTTPVTRPSSSAGPARSPARHPDPGPAGRPRVGFRRPPVRSGPAARPAQQDRGRGHPRG